MLRRTVLVSMGVTGLFTLMIAGALATPPSGSIVAETARGELDRELNVNRHFDNGAKARIKTQGAIEVITQRVEATPGSSFGWHTHPGENVNVILRGTLTLYHAEDCTTGIAYGPGSSFPTSPDQVHLARNDGTENVVFFATYFAPKTTPPLLVRLDAPSPGAGCPQ